MHPLEAIERELRERLFDSGGDMYDAVLAETEAEGFAVPLVVYVASVPAFSLPGGGEVLVPGLIGDIGPRPLVFSPVVDPLLQHAAFPNDASIIYHELLHAMGVPEHYDLLGKDIVAEGDARRDVMGRGVELPLLQTSVGKDIKHKMGFREE